MPLSAVSSGFSGLETVAVASPVKPLGTSIAIGSATLISPPPVQLTVVLPASPPLSSVVRFPDPC
ncbi:MAG: hypothetical protein AAFW70_29705 [Cyanobacteria bacterium J06635_10]